MVDKSVMASRGPFPSVSRDTDSGQSQFPPEDEIDTDDEIREARCETSIDTDDETWYEPVPRKKTKRYLQVWKDEYAKTPGIQKSGVNKHHVYCKYCKKDISIGSSGQFDIDRHVKNSKTHAKMIAASKKNASIMDFLPSKSISNLDIEVLKAETMMTELITEANLPLALADKFTRTFKNAFSDSKIAAKYACGRDKTTAIVKYLAEEESSATVREMRKQVFSLSTDGSSDEKAKQYPLVVCTPDIDVGIKLQLLGIPTLSMDERSTGKNIANLVIRAVDDNDIPWENFISFGSDNAPVMVGNQNGVIKHLKEKQKDVWLAGCPIHLIHIAAQHAAAELPFSSETVGDVLIDTFFYFEQSSKRLAHLQTWQAFYEVEHTNIVKHSKTRWLSLGPCLDRVIENWDALKQLFREAYQELPEGTRNNKDVKTREERAFDFYRSPTNYFLCLFLQYSIPIFERINTRLQTEAPQIHCLRRDLHKLIWDLLLRFKVPEALRGRDVKEINVETERGQLTDDGLIIGDKARKFLKRQGNGLREKRVKEAFKGIRHFFQEAVKYILKKLPIEDELLRRAEVADASLCRTTAVKGEDLRYFVDRFPALLPPDVDVATLLVEFAHFQAENIPDIDEQLPMDKKWVTVAGMKDAAGVKRFSLLAQVMLGILCIPHSNAQCERVFSMVRHNKTWKRGSLGSGTVEALLINKCKTGEAHKRVYSNEAYKNIKSAYYNSLKRKQ